MKNSKETEYNEVGIMLAVDTLIFTIQDEKLKVLLIQIGSGIYEDKWALPGGLVGEKEDIDKAAQRVLSKKAGLKGVYLEQLCTFGDPKRDKRGRAVSIAYFALVDDSSKYKLKTMEYYTDVAWHDARKLPELAFDHKEIIDYGLERLHRKMEYTNVVYGLLPKEFTLPEMQKVYEVVWNKELDKRNFRKQIQRMDIVEPVGRITSTKSRPASLYKFKKRGLVFTK